MERAGRQADRQTGGGCHVRALQNEWRRARVTNELAAAARGRSPVDGRALDESREGEMGETGMRVGGVERGSGMEED